MAPFDSTSTVSERLLGGALLHLHLEPAHVVVVLLHNGPCPLVREGLLVAARWGVHVPLALAHGCVHVLASVLLRSGGLGGEGPRVVALVEGLSHHVRVLIVRVLVLVVIVLGVIRGQLSPTHMPLVGAPSQIRRRADT